MILEQVYGELYIIDRQFRISKMCFNCEKDMQKDKDM